MKSSRNIHETSTEDSQENFLMDGWMWGEEGDREVKDNTKASGLGNQVGSEPSIKKTIAEKEETSVWSWTIYSNQGKQPDWHLHRWPRISGQRSELDLASGPSIIRRATEAQDSWDAPGVGTTMGWTVLLLQRLMAPSQGREGFHLPHYWWQAWPQDMFWLMKCE